MRRFLSAMVVMGAMLGAVGCHTCDVCDDCGDLPYDGQVEGCSSCNSHAVVRQMPTNVAVKPMTTKMTK
jgi:hypothetical protein